jgi:Mg2+-importing ATPase
MSSLKTWRQKRGRRHAAPAAATASDRTSGEQAALAPLSDLLAQLDVQPDGLTSAEAAQRLAEVGPNAPPTTRPGPGAILRTLVLNPLVIILLVASLVSAVVGEFVSASIIVAIVLLSIVLDFAQTYRSQRAADALLAVIAPTSTALRDGSWVEIPRADLVPGDVVRLAAGDLVPADARLLESRDLYVQEAALTGESMPVEKRADPEGHGADAIVLLGTSVVSGTATALVVATGARTTFGEIAQRLAERPPETEFERGLRAFSLLITRTVLVLVVLVFLVNIGIGRDAIGTLLFAVALAVGLTPEFLPMITTVTLTRGAVQMSRQHVIVKHIAAIENFGSMDILCSDKTGTLTSAEIELERVCDPFGREHAAALKLARLNSTFGSGVSNPLDAAILRRAEQVGPEWHKLDEVPFDFERRRVSVVAAADGQRLLISKGAPESIVPICTFVERDGQPQPLDDATRAACVDVYTALSTDGYRVLAVAWAAVGEQQAWTKADEHDLTLAGYLAFLDPPLPGVAETLRELAADGVQVKVLSGDNPLVARQVCTAVGLDADHLLLGSDIDRLSDADLGEVAERTVVFARLSPGQKHRVILALKSRGHVVGYIGDGINDSPSLHAADIGISVANAVDVAREAADIILLEPSLEALHNGILIGRRSFGNVMKYILMGTSSNFGNVMSMAVGSAALPFLPMLPGQILLNNFLYDVSQLTIPTDRVDESFTHKPRRWDIGVIRRFMMYVGPISSLYDILTFFFLLRVLDVSEQGFHTGWFIESLTTQTLVLFVIRTAGNPFRSRPSWPLTLTVLAIVAVGIILPLSPLGGPLGFTSLPRAFYAFLVLATLTYLGLVDIAKRRILRWD